jgi:hypothetical protein
MAICIIEHRKTSAYIFGVKVFFEAIINFSFVYRAGRKHQYAKKVRQVNSAGLDFIHVNKYGCKLTIVS